MEENLTERDILIGLRSDFKSFKEYVTQELREIKNGADGANQKYEAINNRITVVEQREIENTRLRIWVYGTLVATLVSGAFSVANIIK